jgi:WbqC-like protein family
MSVCVISQPRFFPGLHYLHRMMVADVFVIFDTVQFSPRHEENRTKLKTSQGANWLTVPMRKLRRDQAILDTYISNDQPWKTKAKDTIHNLYQKAPFYSTYEPEISDIFKGTHETMTQLDRASWEPAIKQLGISCKFVLASELPISGKGPRLLLDICKHLGSNTYLSGAFGRDYLSVDEFLAEGVEVKFHHYEYPVYEQLYGEFVPFLSYLDMLFNIGLDKDLIMAGAET